MKFLPLLDKLRGPTKETYPHEPDKTNGTEQSGKSDNGKGHTSQGTTEIGGTEYPRWAVDEARQIVDKHGGELESMIQAVLMLADADKQAIRVDSKTVGRGFSHRIGGYVVPKPPRSEGNK